MTPGELKFDSEAKSSQEGTTKGIGEGVAWGKISENQFQLEGIRFPSPNEVNFMTEMSTAAGWYGREVRLTELGCRHLMLHVIVIYDMS